LPAAGGGVPDGPDTAALKAEYKVAYDKAAECIKADGWEISGPEDNASGTGYSIGFDFDTDEYPGSEASYDKCWAQHIKDIEERYHKSLIKTGAEREATYREFIACLDSAGVKDAVVGDSVDRIYELVNDAPEDGLWEASVCLEKYNYQLFQDS
jgi:hypothetical protein